MQNYALTQNNTMVIAPAMKFLENLQGNYLLGYLSSNVCK